MIKIFLSYSHKDQPAKQLLNEHLAGLERTGKLQIWADHMLLPGAEWNAEIRTRLKESQVVLLLISAHFIASDFCYAIEMQEALKMHADKKALVIPVYLSPAVTDVHPFAALQSLPENPRFFSEWPDANAACSNICNGILKSIEFFVKDVVSFQKKMIETCVEDGNIEEACNKLMDFATSFSQDKKYVFEARSTKAAFNNIVKRYKDDFDELRKVSMSILVLMDEIAPLNFAA